MSLWLDMLGNQVRYIQTPSFGRTRIAEAGDPGKPPLLFLHGIGGHLEAYARNIRDLSDQFHVIAYDYVGHGLSEKKIMDYNPLVLVDHLKEVLGVLGIDKPNLSGESLGGWVSGLFAADSPQRVARLMLNTAAGLPVLTEKGQQDLKDLAALSKKAAEQGVSFESIKQRMKWLFHPDNYDMISDELVNLRLALYTQPGSKEVGQRINAMLKDHDAYLTPLEKIECETLFLWTDHNPVHDVETARICSQRVARAQLYVMKAPSAHWPQYEGPEEFNRVTRQFFTDGTVPA